MKLAFDNQQLHIMSYLTEKCYFKNQTTNKSTGKDIFVVKSKIKNNLLKITNYLYLN